MGLSGLEPPTSRLSGVRSNQLSYKPKFWQPPALPYRLQYSTIGRLGLNRRVRDGNGCVPHTHRRQNFQVPRPPFGGLDPWTVTHIHPYFFLRKEVIQPHLPIRLPCYDFTPVISPAFGSSLHCWLSR